MTSYAQLFITVLPVLLLITLGVGLRRANWITETAEDSLFNLVIKVLMPCLIFDSVTGNAMLRAPGNLLLAPLMGFLLTLTGIGVAYAVGRGIGLHVGTGLRTFAMTVGIANYGYLPLPIMEALWGPETRGLVLVHNVGVEAAIWTGGVLVVSGISLRDGWRRLISVPLVTLFVALIINFAGLTPYLPGPLMQAVKLLGACAIPMGLLMTGVSVQPHLGEPGKLFSPRISLGSCLIRLGVLPVIFLAVAKFGPFTPELQRVLIVQGAMPTATISIIVARVYGGQPLTATQIVLLTTMLALFTIPFWIQTGLAWLAG